MTEELSADASSKRLYTTVEAARELGVTPNYLEKTRVYGTGPEFVKLGRSVRYERVALDRWIEGARRRSTSDKGAAA